MSFFVARLALPRREEIKAHLGNASRCSASHPVNPGEALMRECSYVQGFKKETLVVVFSNPPEVGLVSAKIVNKLTQSVKIS